MGSHKDDDKKDKKDKETKQERKLTMRERVEKILREGKWFNAYRIGWAGNTGQYRQYCAPVRSYGLSSAPGAPARFSVEDKYLNAPGWITGIW